jgi:hypothetical protein
LFPNQFHFVPVRPFVLWHGISTNRLIIQDDFTDQHFIENVVSFRVGNDRKWGANTFVSMRASGVLFDAQVSAIPEPSSMALLGMVGLGAWWRTRYVRRISVS